MDEFLEEALMGLWLQYGSLITVSILAACGGYVCPMFKFLFLVSPVLI